MAKALYNIAKERMLTTGLGLDTCVIKAVLIDTADYTFNATHTAALDGTQIPFSAMVATMTLSGKTFTNGVFDAADGAFANVTGDSCEAIIIYNEDYNLPIAYIDGISVVPNGNNINVVWDAAGIFAI